MNDSAVIMKTDDGRSPKVSVVMSVYNAEQYLDEAIGSVLAQTYSDWELVCFNDASPDGSLEILKSYSARDSRVRVIDSKINVKLGGGNNRAIKAARGQYIMFLDADDALMPDAIARCVATAEAEKSEAVFFDYCRFTSANGEEVRVCQLGDDAVALRDDDLRRRILLRTTSHVTALYARSVIVDNDLFFPEGVHYEDNAVTLAIQCMARNPVKLNATFYRYRYDNPSITRSANNPHFFDRIASAELLLGHMKRLGLYGRFKDLIDYQFVNLYFVHTVFGAIYRFDKVQINEIELVKRGVETYVPGYKSNCYYKAQPWKMRLKIETHVRFPRVIKCLSNFSRFVKHLRG